MRFPNSKGVSSTRLYVEGAEVADRDFYSITEAAALAGVQAPELSRAFYSGVLHDSFAPMIGGRRLVLGCFIPEIVEFFHRRQLRRSGGHTISEKH